MRGGSRLKVLQVIWDIFFEDHKRCGGRGYRFIVEVTTLKKANSLNDYDLKYGFKRDPLKSGRGVE